MSVMNIFTELFLLPFLVGVAVFLAELTFKWWQRPRPLLELHSIDGRVSPAVLKLQYGNLGRTALHSPLINISGFNKCDIQNASDFSFGENGILILKPGTPLLPKRIFIVMEIKISLEKMPSEIEYFISGEEASVRASIKIDQVTETAIFMEVE